MDLDRRTRRWLLRELTPLGALLLFVALAAGYGLSWQTNEQEVSAPAQELQPALLDVLAAPASKTPLLIPVEGVAPENLSNTFDDPRSGGRTREALDILAPQGTPVRAAADGTIARLFAGDAGGLTLYQLNADSSRVFYYAHLARYAEGLVEGRRVRRGQVLAYVGASGNAPASTPHLHFAVWAAK